MKLVLPRRHLGLMPRRLDVGKEGGLLHGILGLYRAVFSHQCPKARMAHVATPATMIPSHIPNPLTVLLSAHAAGNDQMPAIAIPVPMSMVRSFSSSVRSSIDRKGPIAVI